MKSGGTGFEKKYVPLQNKSYYAPSGRDTKPV
jgi:hypothetical protein